MKLPPNTGQPNAMLGLSNSPGLHEETPLELKASPAEQLIAELMQKAAAKAAPQIAPTQALQARNAAD